MAKNAPKAPPVPDVQRAEVHAITLDSVESSQIHSAGHDGRTTMAMRFKNWSGELSDEYRYSDVSPEAFDAFLAADSLGKYHGLHFRDNPKFPCVRVREALIPIGAEDVS